MAVNLPDSTVAGMSSQVNRNSVTILDRIISDHQVWQRMIESGLTVRRNTVCRAALIAFLEDLAVIRKNPETLQRCTNRFSTDKMLHDIMRKILPGSRISLLGREANRCTTISFYLTPKSFACIGDIISRSTAIKDGFVRLEEYGCVPSRGASNVTSIILRAALCYFLLRIDDMYKRPELYQRALTLDNSERVLCRIRDRTAGGSRRR